MMSQKGSMHEATIGAETHYRRFPDAHRPETLEQAAETDRLCAQAWRGHPRYVLIDNANRDWQDKARVAREVLTRWVESDIMALGEKENLWW